MLNSLLKRLRQLSRRIYVRVTLFAVLAVVAVLLSKLIAPLIPFDLKGRVGAEAVDTILNILATSMLTVTTFSLTIMLNALISAANLWTPRSHLILREDTVTQSVLANFLGAYLFSLIGIIMRHAGLFDEREIVVLFFMSLLVVGMVVVSLIRWIVHLEGLGSLTFTASQIEAEVARAVTRAADLPCHGAHALDDAQAQIPQSAWPLRADRCGYLQQIFQTALQDAAEAADFRVYVVTEVGQYLLRGEPLAYVDCAETLPEDAEQRLRNCLPLSELRSFEEDPAFGARVLAEVAVKALSPGINDPGTAIDIINRMARVLSSARVGAMEEPQYPRIWARRLDPETLFEAGFDPIARCAGEDVDVHRTVQVALRQVCFAARDPRVAEAARACAGRALDRAALDIRYPPDLEKVRAASEPGRP
ncbi:DUF2254 domain-containing protein [Ponticoccus gilvus]|nr:DUF2254 domain-containing protein [Enemella evansiae]